MTASPHRRRGLRRIAALLCAALSGTSADADTPDRASLVVPPGQFVNLGTHRLYYRCEGAGAPTVVIDAGIGGAAVEWTPVQELLAHRTRVCTYDRAGYGWSDPGPGPRTTEQSVSELRRLLELAGVTPPFVLVGHSFGGFNMRYFAASRPQDVLALVLVDSSHPDERPEISARAHPAAHAINLERAPTPWAGTNPYGDVAGFLNSRRKAVFAQMNELRNFALSAEQVRATGSLGDLPLLVLTRDGADGADPRREAQWQRRQRALAALSSRSTLEQVPHAGHDIHLVRPASVSDAVSGLLASLNTDAAARPSP